MKGFAKVIVFPSFFIGCDLDLLKFVGVCSTGLPEDFTVHQHLKKTFIENRLKKLESGQSIDWATAEGLAIGSLLMQGLESILLVF